MDGLDGWKSLGGGLPIAPSMLITKIKYVPDLEMNVTKELSIDIVSGLQ